MHPDAPRADEIRSLKQPVFTQDDRSIYNIFLKQFSNRKDGYWPDLLEDQFINGYYPKEGGGTNSPETDGEDLLQRGPDPNGGFFYPVFKTELLTVRHYYDYGYQQLSRDLRSYFSKGNLVSLTYDMNRSAHVVTLWGIEYDASGNLTGIYFSDSDDDKSYGMQRYSVINKGGRAVVTTADNGSGSPVSCITALSPGQATWDRFFSPQKTELDLHWGETDFIYDGTLKQPELTASNIAPGDDIVLSVNGDGTNAETYTASAVISGKDADRYTLPAGSQTHFSILPSQTIFHDGVKSYRDQTETDSFTYGDTISIKAVPKATGLSPDSAEAPNVLLPPTTGQMALFSDGHQLSDFVNADASGTYTMTYLTSSGILSPGLHTLTAVFRGDTNMVDHSENITVTLTDNSTGDSYISVDFLAPTCETDGIKAHYKDAYGKLYVNENGGMTEVTLQDLIIPATGHQPGNWIQKDDIHFQECQNGCGRRLNEGHCTGGAADFPDRAICEICGFPYGNYPEKPDTETPDTVPPDNQTPNTEHPDTDTPGTPPPNAEIPDVPKPESPNTDSPDTAPDTAPEYPGIESPDQGTQNSAPEAPEVSADTTIHSEKAAQTGDPSSARFYIVLLLFSGVLAVCVSRRSNLFQN